MVFILVFFIINIAQFYFEGILKAIDILIALMCVRLMFVSQKYNDNYLIKIDYDNIYITQYFRNIDNRRKEAGKLSVLPLNKVTK